MEEIQVAVLYQSNSSSANKLPSTMLSVGDVARLLGVHVNTVRRWSDNGQLTTYRIGPRCDRRFDAKDIDSLLEKAKQIS